jgi:hypothetical protein
MGAPSANAITDHGDKLDVLNNLSAVINGTVYLKISADQSADAASSAQLALRLSRLNTEYSALSGALWQDWIGQAAAIKTQMTVASAGVTQCVNDIKAGVNTAQNVVKAIGYIDQAIQIAAKLLP